MVLPHHNIRIRIQQHQIRVLELKGLSGLLRLIKQAQVPVQEDMEVITKAPDYLAYLAVG